MAWAGVSTTASAVRAYELKERAGQLVHWRTSTVTLHLAPVRRRGHIDQELVERSLEIATEAWRGIHGAPDVIVEPGGPEEPAILDGVNSVHLLHRWPEHLGERLAVTVSTYDHAGRLLDTDILINGEMPFDVLDEHEPARRFDLPSVLAHEVGHVLGLDESEVPEATMYSRLRRGQVFQRTLHTDDEAGVMALYGPVPIETQESLGCDASGRSTGWMLVGLWLLLLVPRREPIRLRAGRRSVRRPGRPHARRAG